MAGMTGADGGEVVGSVEEAKVVRMRGIITVQTRRASNRERQ
jgi:hypothetical protein